MAGPQMWKSFGIEKHYKSHFLCKRCKILHFNKNGYRYKFDQYQNLAAFIDASHDIANIIIQCTLGPAAK